MLLGQEDNPYNIVGSMGTLTSPNGNIEDIKTQTKRQCEAVDDVGLTIELT